MTYSDNTRGLWQWQWQLFGLMYAVALLAGLAVVASWPGVAVGIVELIGVFVAYLMICAAVVGLLFGAIYAGVLAYRRPWTASDHGPLRMGAGNNLIEKLSCVEPAQPSHVNAA